MPYKKKYIHGDQLPWITLEISQAISRRNRLLKKFRKNRSNENWDCYRKQRSLVTTFKRKSLKSYCIQASAECIHPGEFWKKFQPLLPSKCVNRQSINLLEDGQLLTDETKVANTFNDYFIDCASAQIPNLHESSLSSHPSTVEIQRRHSHLSVSFYPVKEAYILKLLESLKPNKATGPDRISPRVLAVSAKSIASLLTKLINHLITHNTWPTPWKRSNVSPIHKKESESLKENYRPVSVLTAISKIFDVSFCD